MAGSMSTVPLGRGGPPVSRLGLGLMGMSGTYGPADESESLATIRAALDAGVTLLDTGDFYGNGHNELLLGRALREADRESVFVGVKFGALRDPGGAFVGHDASPAAVKNFLAHTLTRLGTDYVTGSGPTISTCTSRPGSTRACPSRTPWARSPR